MSLLSKLNIKRKVTVDLEFSADDWMLYDDVSRDNVAQNLNTVVSFCINNAATRRQALEALAARVPAFDKYGAMDSEASRLISLILDECFGTR